MTAARGVPGPMAPVKGRAEQPPWRVDVHAHILSPSYLAEVTRGAVQRGRALDRRSGEKVADGGAGPPRGVGDDPSGRIQELPLGVLPPMAMEFPFDVTRAAVNPIVRGSPGATPIGRTAMRSVLEITPPEHVLDGSDLPFGRYAMGAGRGSADPSPDLSETSSTEQRQGGECTHALAHFPRLAGAMNGGLDGVTAA